VADAGGRRVLYAVDPAARRAGLRPGMVLADARAQVPALETLPARPREDKAGLARLAAWCNRYSPWAAAEDPAADMGTSATADPASLALEQAGAAGLWLDATGCAHLFGGEAAMLQDMVGRIGRLGFAARAAMADTPGCAWAVARYAADDTPWAVVPPGAARTALAALPVAALRLPPADAAGLRGLGLRRIGDLYDLPRSPLAARFGDGIARRLDAALGVAPESISPAPPAALHRVRHAFAEPIGRVEDIAAALELLCGALCDGLARAAMGARRVGLALYRTDGTLVRRGVGTARASRDPRHLARLFAPHLETVDPGFGIEDMILAAERVEPLGAAQPGLSRETACGAADSPDALIDRLANRLGTASVLRLRTRESHWPERASSLAPITGPAPAPSGTKTAMPSTGPRPARLLRPPEPVDAVAEAGGPPALFRWRRAVHRVVRVEGPERIAPEWWRDGAAATRDYYRIEDSAGRRYWLYREDAGEDSPPSGIPAWFLHGVFG
jgi:protein ImuB